MRGSNVSQVRVVIDSAPGIPAPLMEEVGVVVVPRYVQFEQGTYLDGDDLSGSSSMLVWLPIVCPPTTSQPPLGTFAEVYQRLTEQTKYKQRC